MRRLQVGRQSAGFLRRGHPWVRRDRFTRGLEGCRSGDAVTLVDEQGQPLASALVDPDNPICARVYHQRPERPFDPVAALERAWERRRSLHDDPATDCYRLVHGEADFLPGLRVEGYADHWVLLFQSQAIWQHRQALVTGLQTLAPAGRLILRQHFDDLRRSEVQSTDRDGRPVDPSLVITGQEDAVRVQLTPHAGLATGIYVDQRGTRRWLRQLAAGRRLLNLFAYTGVFSSACLLAGAEQAVDVDRSGPALQTAAANARCNRVDRRHKVVHDDCLHFLHNCQERFDLVVCDPPTAATGGRGWVSRRDYPALLEALRPRLNTDALVVLCNNTIHRDACDLDRLAERHLPALPPITADRHPRLAEDIPQLRGFPEGRPYRLTAVGRAGALSRA